MTKILRREQVIVPDRRDVPAATKRAVLERSGGRCEHPGCEVRSGLDWEHRIPRGLGGGDTPGNIQLLCQAHHSPKTKDDISRIAKAKRQEAKSFGDKKPSKLKGPKFPKGPKQKIPTRPFPKRKKAPG